MYKVANGLAIQRFGDDNDYADELTIISHIYTSI